MAMVKLVSESVAPHNTKEGPSGRCDLSDG